MRKLGDRLGFAALFASLLAPADARACGGCFHPENQAPEQGSVVLAHRMALSISPDASVLWDQVRYAGSPAEFAWVLPVRPGARLEVASDAWFEALDAATGVRIRPPALQCVTQTTQQISSIGYRYRGCSGTSMSAGCAADAESFLSTETEVVTDVTELAPPEEPITIVHQGSAGPYETVTLHADVPGALPTWLASHGYAIDDDIHPILDAYAKEGFDFIALRLLPDKGVQQMKPVRVIQPGAVTTLPLRMVAAGTGANVSLTLFVIGEGRYRPSSFPEVPLPAHLTWDFFDQKSNWSLDRQALFSSNPTGWLTTFAQQGALFSPTFDPMTGSTVQYVTGLGAAFTLADAFMDQALANGEAALSCAGIFDTLAQSADKVVDTCPPDGTACADTEVGQIDARYLECGPIRDLARAFVGLHPRDVWVTRLEAELPREALVDDLVLDPAQQTAVSNVITASDFKNPPCQVAATTALSERPRAAMPPLLTAAALVLAVSVARRRRRPLPAKMRS
ncbi:Hypothetical protein A7982_10648 [Minicystis rosea]|nr:Hypothetical protein A7982_10648 [Minicystis rosea]